MTQREHTEEEIRTLIAAGILTPRAIIGTYIVIKAIGSYRSGGVVTGNEVPNTPPTPIRYSDYKYGNYEESGKVDKELCKYRHHVPELPENHCDF